MKNRKTIIVVFMLVACMLIGVGYAAVESSLFAKGSIILTDEEASDELNQDVYFTAVKDQHNCNANVDTTNNDNVIVRITGTNSTMAFKGDFATFTATVKNEAGVDVRIEPTYAEFDDIIVTTDNTEYTCLKNGEVEITFTITLDKNVPTGGLTIGGVGAEEIFVTFTVTPQ